ncbi:MAG: phospholipase, partial [Candidatus Neomarinimicrobiota bacterium]|nr:phospholipase [Candidatus Neomarinimicrobiota bacterium]
CGGGDPTQANKLINIPIWAWHGDSDRVISVSRTQEMVQAIDSAGGKIKYTEIKNRGHDSWLDVWNSQDLWKWLYKQRK